MQPRVLRPPTIDKQIRSDIEGGAQKIFGGRCKVSKVEAHNEDGTSVVILSIKNGQTTEHRQLGMHLRILVSHEGHDKVETRLLGVVGGTDINLELAKMEGDILSVYRGNSEIAHHRMMLDLRTYMEKQAPKTDNNVRRYGAPGLPVTEAKHPITESTSDELYLRGRV